MNDGISPTPETGNWIAADDYYRNVKTLDEALNGPGGATRPLLIDVLAQVQAEVRKRGAPLLAAAPTPASREQAEQQDSSHFAANGGEAKSLQPLLDALHEAHELLGKMYALMQRGQISLTHGAGGGCWSLPDQIGAWLEKQDAARNRTPARQEAPSSEKSPASAPLPVQGQELAVWFGCMPESNGKANWSAILHRGDMAEGFTIARSEHHDRVRYDADKMRWLIGELDKEPSILDYDGDMLSPEGWEHPCALRASSAPGAKG